MTRPMRRVLMLSRRGAVKRALLAAAFLATLAPGAHAAPSEAQLGQAAAFVRQAGGEMAALVTTPVPMAQRKQRLRGLIDQVVDVPAVARFCLGRFWRAADPAQRAQYVALFQDVLVNSVADRMGDYPSGSVRVEIGRAYAEGDDAVVPTTILRPDNPTVSVALDGEFFHRRAAHRRRERRGDEPAADRAQRLRLLPLPAWRRRRRADRRAAEAGRQGLRGPNMATEIYALRYGSQDRDAQANFLLPADPHDGPMPIDYFVWAIREGDRVTVVDTGFGAEVAARRGRKLDVAPEALLRRFGVAPESVRDVIVTHLHYDHAGNLDAFPNATFHLQDAEMGFATGRCMCHRALTAAFEVEDVVTMVRRVFDGRVRFHAGDGEVVPGVTVHAAPGHTPGLQCVRVGTARGPVVLASDATHFYANRERGNPYPILADLPAMAESWARLGALAGSEDRIVPGHDPLVMRRYPRFAGMEQVACLHEAPRAT